MSRAAERAIRAETPNADQAAARGRLEVRGVSKAFTVNGAPIAALNDVSLTVRPGEFVALLGPSGCGKSTLLRLIAGLDRDYKGSIVQDGEAVTGTSLERGIVFQEPRLLPWARVLANVEVGLGRDRKAEGAHDRARQALEEVGLADKREQWPAVLSGGQKQRVAIARALAMRPQIMLFDEPTSALDPELRSEVLSVLRDIAAGGMTMLVVTHEMAFAREIADQVVFMEAGRIRFAGPPDAFFRSDDPRIVRFLSAILS